MTECWDASTQTLAVSEFCRLIASSAVILCSTGNFWVSLKSLNFDFLTYGKHVLKGLSLGFFVRSSQAGSRVNAAGISEATSGCVQEPNGTTSFS